MTRVLTFTLCFFFIGTMFGSLFHMTLDMTTLESSGGCPFMTSGESLCSMNALDHLNAWKDNFVSTTPVLLLLGALLSSVVLLTRTFPRQNILKHILFFFIPSLFFIQRMYSVPTRSLQPLFARGILHPKLH